MRMLDVYKIALKVLREVLAKNPERSFKSSSGEKVTLAQVISNLDQVCSWLYSDFSTDDIAKVVRCKHCRYYKKFKQKDAPKALPFWACTIDKKKRDPMYFCKDGIEK